MLIPHLDLPARPRPGHLSSTHLSPGSKPGNPMGSPHRASPQIALSPLKRPPRAEGARESRNTLWGTLAARSSQLGKAPKAGSLCHVPVISTVINKDKVDKKDNATAQNGTEP